MSQDDLYTKIFGTSSTDQKANILRNVLEQFPYFSIAQFCLLKETMPGDPDHHQSAGKTALQFNNPFYLRYLLNKPAEPQTKVSPSAIETQIKTQEEISIPDVEREIHTTKAADEEMIFEPLFATDYFASQGIKLSEEVKADDKLGKQLKSFTDWLKTMKKVHDQRLPAGNEQLDLAVQTIAEKSNMEEKVITESMAEVYINQGKPAKAREIYDKLSLLNPSKSAYFAAKSENLNT